VVAAGQIAHPQPANSRTEDTHATRHAFTDSLTLGPVDYQSRAPVGEPGRAITAVAVSSSGKSATVTRS
jgi:hypothetical protein